MVSVDEVEEDSRSHAESRFWPARYHRIVTLPDGIYDQLLTERVLACLDAQRAGLATFSAGQSELLLDALTRQLSAALADLPESVADRGSHDVEIINALLRLLRQRMQSLPSGSADSIDLIATPPRVLRSIGYRPGLAQPPMLGLTAPWLFTAGKGSPALLQEVRKELACADSVDILVSFITVSGVRKLYDVLQQITAPGASGEGSVRLRILTTTYTGATEARALDELARLPGCEVRVSLDGRRTRLHAKAWLFHRRSGFGSAYVGSANLSGAALTGGLEWTVKLTQRAQPSLFERAQAHFETLWADGEFQRYDPDDNNHRRALVAALDRESFGGEGSVPLSFFDLQPKTYQQDMLEQLELERSSGRRRNLLVAATGTGKTVVAAFDYRRTCRQQGGLPRLLFVAHREEILRQALRTFREVLRQSDFGELLVGGSQPDHMDHLFATIDSVCSRGIVDQLGAGHWHTVIIDECHRLAADRLSDFAGRIQPNMLLGLTATPERSDGQPISHFFDMRADGAPAVELRLWHALDLQLLAPFEYYACDDATDFSAVPWDRPGERETLDKLVSSNHVRVRLVVNEWRRLTADPRQSKALVFCVSVAHARFVTDCLNQAGLPAACVVGDTAAEERRRAPQRLAAGDLCALVTVDLYNEGVDLPEVDTLLLLRPTQSPVLFQQQIGRGLRLAPGKESCLVLDFVGQHRVDFRFDRLLSSMTGLSKRDLTHAVEDGFGSLPPGCHIHLQRQAREQVLQCLRALTGQNWRRLKLELQAYAALKGRTSIHLLNFLEDQALDLDDVYRASVGTARSGWSNLKRDAGLLLGEPGPEETYFSRRFADLLHVDDAHRLDVLAKLANGKELLGCTARERLTAQMLAYQIDGQTTQVGGVEAFLKRLHGQPNIPGELLALTELLSRKVRLTATALPGLEDTPLVLHASYGQREILTAVGWLTAERRTPFQAGVLALPSLRTELLFVTLDKSEGYHDRIAYHDYAISTELFHWQSQNNAGPDTPVGRRYLQVSRDAWRFQLFVRGRKGQPYRACGPVKLESAEGGRPMTIIWRLVRPLPTALFSEFSVLRGS